ncbi:unnamed protein product, partial [Ixodes pacificus]
MAQESVKVVVRCRPMNAREKEEKCQTIVSIDGSAGQCSLLNPADRGAPPKCFTFDGAYDVDSTTEQIYFDIVYPIVESVSEGYNGTVFAYGQTGCGKSFSMQGCRLPQQSKQKGIIPRAFEHIFEAIAAADASKYLVHASYLEIYNEDIRDLLADDPKKKVDLKEHPDKGVYVPGLSLHPVQDVQSCEAVMERGWKNRSVGATLMNADSSRSHSIFTIHLEQMELTGRKCIRSGKLNLVDLAGSERQAKTGATGERLREATKINLSLSALGNVISALVDGRSKHIPYRDSKLTRLLQDSLGGNTRTLMLACLSPADSNYDETLSTLRYANRAKNIQNRPCVNEDPKDALLREYREELERLKQLLTGRNFRASREHTPPEEGGNVEEERVAESHVAIAPYSLFSATPPLPRVKQTTTTTTLHAPFVERLFRCSALEDRLATTMNDSFEVAVSRPSQCFSVVSRHRVVQPTARRHVENDVVRVLPVICKKYFLRSTLCIDEALIQQPCPRIRPRWVRAWIMYARNSFSWLQQYEAQMEELRNRCLQEQESKAKLEMHVEQLRSQYESQLRGLRENAWQKPEVLIPTPRRRSTPRPSLSLRCGVERRSVSTSGKVWQQRTVSMAAMQAKALERLQELQEKMLGGEKKHDAELKERRAKRKSFAEKRIRALAEALAKVDDEDRTLLPDYEDINAELKIKSSLVKKAKKKIQALEQEVRDLQTEFEADRTDYLETIRRQDQQLRLLGQILEKVQPCIRRDSNYANLELVKAQSVWDQDAQRWRLPELSIQRTKLPPTG